MPLASPKGEIPEVKNAAVVTSVGSSDSIREARENARVLGQIRTHCAAQAVPSILSTIDITDMKAVKSKLSELASWAMTGE